MDFVDWWKNSSKTATEAHYALRFDEDELKQIRQGFLSGSAQQKVRQRLNDLKKRNTFLWIGCGVPALFLGLLILITLGFFFFRAVWQNSSNPIAWIFTIFFVIVTTVIFLVFVKILLEWIKRRTNTQNDLQNNKVGKSRGKVFIKISRSENSFNISYSIDGIQFILFDDAIGWEIHTHFFGGPNITGQSSRQTTEDYIFYYLPASKRLLHFEPA